MLGGRRDTVPPDPDEDDNSLTADSPFSDPVVVEFADVLDLHAIPPRQIRAVVEEYLEEAKRRGIKWVRIVHGKGIGVQRETVRTVLSRTPFVIEFTDAPAEAGGWGATIVTLGEESDN
jgi:dsDNA-specific endonuclease/ATPase MutS2